jgi:hypothetical protein
MFNTHSRSICFTIYLRPFALICDSFFYSNYSGMTVGARGAAGEMLQIPFRYFCRTSCPYWVGTEGLNRYFPYLELLVNFVRELTKPADCDITVPTQM